MTEFPSVTIWELGLWPLVLAILAVANRWSGHRYGFLAYAYIAGFAIIRWFGAMVHALPWRDEVSEDSAFTVAGFAEANVALICFALGVVLAGLLSPLPASQRYAHAIPIPPEQRGSGHKLANLILAIGGLALVASKFDISVIPSLTAVVSTCKNFLIVGVCLKIWLAWTSNDRTLLVCWLVASVILPIESTITSGFIGFGTFMLVTILMFVASFYRPQWHVVLGAVAGIYLGLTVWVGHAENRERLREAVREGASIGERVALEWESLSNVGAFDITNPRHLYWINMRLNQNVLDGAAVDYTTRTNVFANGQTFLLAAAAIIPRVLWPDKPIFAGGTGVVTQYTGIDFAEGTSVGMGQVFEFYINFGQTGVVLGFLAMGLFFGWLDINCTRCLARKDWTSFATYFLVGNAALQTGGSFVEISASVATAAILGSTLAYFVARSRSAQAAPVVDALPT